MKITADTNVLLRALTEDHPQQTRQAKVALTAAEMVVVPNVALCEAAWVLKSGYGRSASDVAQIIRNVAGNSNTTVDVPAVHAGLAVLDAGGDFADGVIAYEGARLGGETFASFDKGAVRRLQALGRPARLLG